LRWRDEFIEDVQRAGLLRGCLEIAIVVTLVSAPIVLVVGVVMWLFFW
jgi:hypothetical protein